jgi:hypothetical protein
MIVPALRARALAVRTDLRFDAETSPGRRGPGQLNMRPSACIFMHRTPALRMPAHAADRGDVRAPGAVLVAVPAGSVADVLGAVTGIESTAVIDGASLSGAMSPDRFAFSSAHQGARRSQGRNPRAGWPCRP